MLNYQRVSIYSFCYYMCIDNEHIYYQKICIPIRNEHVMTHNRFL